MKMAFIARYARDLRGFHTPGCRKSAPPPWDICEQKMQAEGSAAGRAVLRVNPVVVAALLMLVLAVAGCGGAPSPPPRVTPDRLSDADPTRWTGTNPATLPVQGVDLSRFQGAVDWPKLKAAGLEFAWLKATEGGDRVDPAFAENWRAARRAGVARGAYHFYYHCRPASEQAAWFIENAPREAGALPPVLDIEWTPDSPTCTLRPDGAVVRAGILEFQRIVAAHYGQRPVIYTTVDFWRDNDLGRLRGEEFWLRSVAAQPGAIYPGQRWTFWQFSATGLVPGVVGPTDRNTFNGSKAAWATWRTARAQ